MLNERVLVPWAHAKLEGRPEFQVVLYDRGYWRGTVWLSRREHSALIQSASGASTEHWFDELKFSFEKSKPSYGLVDARGTLEMRTITE